MPGEGKVLNGRLNCFETPIEAIGYPLVANLLHDSRSPCVHVQFQPKVLDLSGCLPVFRAIQSISDLVCDEALAGAKVQISLLPNGAQIVHAFLPCAGRASIRVFLHLLENARHLQFDIPSRERPMQMRVVDLHDTRCSSTHNNKHILVLPSQSSNGIRQMSSVGIAEQNAPVLIFLWAARECKIQKVKDMLDAHGPRVADSDLDFPTECLHDRGGAAKLLAGAKDSVTSFEHVIHWQARIHLLWARRACGTTREPLPSLAVNLLQDDCSSASEVVGSHIF